MRAGMTFGSESLDALAIHRNQRELAGDEERVNEYQEEEGQKAERDVYRVAP